jgi:hypothetical protein
MYTHEAELRVAVEMILDGALRAAGDEHQRVSARRQGFVHCILNERLVDDRQHLLGARFGHGQESRAAAGHRKYTGLYRLMNWHRQIIADFQRSLTSA